MRDIKFRAWDKEEKGFHYIILYEGTWRIDMIDPNQSKGITYGLDEWKQFTGLKDKNGKEIYEGDILECPVSRKVMVIWRKGAFFERDLKDSMEKFEEDIYDYYEGQIRLMDGEDREVIGNIYENQELLES
jgi:uncharacterized phage protein (TIGR01671 family)